MSKQKHNLQFEPLLRELRLYGKMLSWPFFHTSEHFLFQIPSGALATCLVKSESHRYKPHALGHYSDLLFDKHYFPSPWSWSALVELQLKANFSWISNCEVLSGVSKCLPQTLEFFCGSRQEHGVGGGWDSTEQALVQECCCSVWAAKVTLHTNQPCWWMTL